MIKAALRFRPFSRAQETECLIPKTNLLCRVFAKRLEIWDDSCLAAISFSFAGLLRNQVVMADLEDGSVVVSGFTDSGFFRYKLEALVSGFLLHVLKEPQGLVVDVLTTKYQLDEKGGIYFFHTGDRELLYMPQRERLSLGCSKAQDAEMILRRQDIREIVPILYFFSQSIASRPLCDALSCDSVIEQRKLQDMALAGFKSLFVPVMNDACFRGYTHPFANSEGAAALATCYPYLRQLFFREKNEEWSFLPCLLPQFYSGRMVDIRSKQGHHISFEWTKKEMRRVIITPAKDDEITIQFPSSVKKLRSSMAAKTHIIECGERICLKAGIPLLLDNFQK